MFATLTGLGLASAAGLNAYIPLLAVGLLARFTDLVPLGESWQWLEHPVTLATLTVLLAVEFTADKVPALDSVNDLLQTVVRPTSGGVTFGAGVSSVRLDEVTAASGATAGDGVSWGPVVAGAVVALLFHLAKSLARPLANTVTGGCAAPVVSFLEDVVSAVSSLLALLLPVLILVVFPLMAAAGVWAARRGRRLRARRREAAEGTSP
ncbi:DUF4126 domain-containing protein [Nocardiopsis sp. FR26]|uniref:DUF4126 domain-containing protein n=1 Tax=Nocardiopsis sp. FR26 TaxID=2605987 RepID=UPI00135AF9CA|nr:DUF4126 domain-containing protein [Nocardiopsis sp. FR26]